MLMVSQYTLSAFSRHGACLFVDTRLLLYPCTRGCISGVQQQVAEDTLPAGLHPSTFSTSFHTELSRLSLISSLELSHLILVPQGYSVPAEKYTRCTRISGMNGSTQYEVSWKNA